MKGASLRFESAWIAVATSSFPVPLSPVTRIRASVGATRLTRSRTASMASDDPTRFASGPSVPWRARVRSRARRTSSAPFTVSSTDSGVRGFSMKWKAPIRVASTASEREASPLIITTVVAGACSRYRGSASSPVMPGSMRSSSTTSGSRSSISASPSSAVPASRTRYPSASSRARSERRMLPSSSTIRISLMRPRPEDGFGRKPRRRLDRVRRRVLRGPRWSVGRSQGRARFRGCGS